MNRPYIICHMMTSLDGRIDCAMVGQLEGVREYYTTLDELEQVRADKAAERGGFTKKILLKEVWE